ncbi:MAG: copper ion binding protein, partial [Deltaproteobacteria bacterium]|nr:copper ion binding protein [Deltaproteobacteria bacterium]
MSVQTIPVAITGMSCASCALAVERALKDLPGIKDVEVNFAVERASVSFDDRTVAAADVVEKIRDAGYGVVTASLDVHVSGMTCANCAVTIERTLNKKVPGVILATVNFAAERAYVEYIPAATTPEEILVAIEKAGYGVIRSDGLTDDEDAEREARQT